MEECGTAGQAMDDIMAYGHCMPKAINTLSEYVITISTAIFSRNHSTLSYIYSARFFYFYFCKCVGYCKNVCI